MKIEPKKYPFIDLTNDRNFKLFFSRNKEVLLSLLKTFLPLPEKKSIQSVEIISDKRAENKVEKEKQSTATKQSLYWSGLNFPVSYLPYRRKNPLKRHSFQNQFGLTLKDSALYSFTIGGKQSILDLNIQLNTGERIDVEMHPRVGGDKGCYTVLSSILACKGWCFTGPGSIQWGLI